MVAALVVMLGPAVVRAVAFVPAIRKPLHRLGLLAVEALKEAVADHLAVVSGASLVDADGSADLLLVRRHDVDQVAQALGVVVPPVQSLESDVNVDSASPAGAALHSRVAEGSEESLWNPRRIL